MVVMKPKEIGDADFANYFCTYGYLYHQKDMLEDQARMTAYHNAVRMNPRSFKDKVVLDVGTGSGILAIWAAQNGAKKVYAVEATYMATHARKLIKANGLDHVIEVLQSTVEEVELPEKVDVIISEWMGYFLLRESMFDSVIVARDRWLKEGGAMFPSHAKMYLAPIRTGTAAQKHVDFEDSCAGWDEFADQTLNTYGVDMRALTEPFEQEQTEFFMNTSAWVDVHPSQMLGEHLSAEGVRPAHGDAGGDEGGGRAVRAQDPGRAGAQRPGAGWRVLRLVRRLLQGLGRQPERDGRGVDHRAGRERGDALGTAGVLRAPLHKRRRRERPAGAAGVETQAGEPAPVRLAVIVETGCGDRAARSSPTRTSATRATCGTSSESHRRASP